MSEGLRRWRPLGLVVALVILYFVFDYALSRSKELKWESLELQPGFLLGAFALYLFGWLCFSGVWKELFSRCGEELSWKDAALVLLLPQMAAYLPLRVESWIGRFWILRRLGLAKTAAMTRMVGFEATLALSAMLLATGGFLLASHLHGLELHWGWWCLGTSAFAVWAILLFWERPWRWVLRLRLRQRAREPGGDEHGKLNPGLTLWGFQFLGWMGSASAFWCLAVALGWSSRPDAWLLGMSTFWAAKTAGYLIWVLPAGLGVFEAVVVMGLEPLESSPAQWVALLAAARLFQVCLDFAGSGIAWLVYRRQSWRLGTVSENQP